MAIFKTVRVAIMRNSTGGLLDRQYCRKVTGKYGTHWCLPLAWTTQEMEVGDTITIEEHDEEIE
jgi:hypothetical protein